MTGMASGEKLVAVYEAAGEAEAQIIRGLLEINNIPCLLRSNAAPSVHVFAVDGMGLVQVVVPQSKAAEARRLIAEK